jgi:hypothetical protein
MAYIPPYATRSPYQGIGSPGLPGSRVSGLHDLGSSPMVTGHMVTLAFGSLGLSGHWSRVSPWYRVSIGSWARVKPLTRAKPRGKSLAHGQSQTNSPGSNPQTRVTGRAQGQTISPGSNVRGLGSRVSMVSRPSTFTMRAHLGFWLWRSP